MPLHYYRSHDSCEVILWRIEENLDFFRERLVKEGFPTAQGDSIKHAEKAIQWFASRYLLIETHPAAIDYYIRRKPYLRYGPKISFSHSGENVGVLFSKSDSGLDLQIFDEKLIRIKEKFTTGKEIMLVKAQSEIASLALIWSIKEAIFKRYGTGVPFLSIEILEYDAIGNKAIAQLNKDENVIIHRLQVDLIGDMSLAYVLE